MSSNKSTKLIKRSTIVFISLITLLGVFLIAIQSLLENQLENVLNNNPDRTYEITYEKFDLDFMLKGFKLKNARIAPLNDNDSSSITCTLKEIKVKDFNWRALLINKKLNISEMVFKEPAFIVTRGLSKDKTNDDSNTKIQQLFGDILSRANLTSFKLIDGSFSLIKKGNKTEEIARIGKINLEAKDIQTDSVQWKHPIPFKLGEISSSIKDVMFLPNDYSVLTCGALNYNPENSSITINDVSLAFNKNWVAVSEQLGESIDLISFDLKSLTIQGIETGSQLYKDLDIRSELLVIDGLQLNDHKNKNLPRLHEKKQALFSGMVAAIPFDLRVDTILIKNTNISYTELGKGKEEGGTFLFNQLNGNIHHFTTIKSYQDIYKKFELNINGKICNSGKLTATISVPYAVEEFDLKGRIENLDVTELNPTIQPMAGIVAESGIIHLVEIKMHANTKSSYNQLIMNYDNLKISLLKEKEEEVKKRGLLSFAANSMVRTSNLPADDNYMMAKYTTKRNEYRAPFNLVYLALQEGFLQILPTKMAKELMKQQKKQQQKKKQKK